MRVYIAGPMSGFHLYNHLAFDQAKMAWELSGWEVVTPFDTNSIVWQRHYGRPFNPAEDKCDYGDPILGEMLLEDFRALIDAEVVAFLDGWQRSRGATMEHTLAKSLGKDIRDAKTFLRLEENVLQEANRLVYGDRQADYGHPIEDFTRTGRMWGAILGIPDVDPAKVALCMCAVKMSREVNRSKRDNAVDLAGYAGTLAMVREKQAQ